MDLADDDKDDEVEVIPSGKDGGSGSFISSFGRDNVQGKSSEGIPGLGDATAQSDRKEREEFYRRSEEEQRQVILSCTCKISNRIINLRALIIYRESFPKRIATPYLEP